MSSKVSDADFQSIFQFYIKLIQVEVHFYEKKIEQLILPHISEQMLVFLCNNVSNMFEKEPIILKLSSPIVIVGDLHGHILDLFRILFNHGLPPKTNYLFLGDLVNRGEFSLETVLLVFIMKILFPNSIYVIRGNHEFQDMVQKCGFSEEIRQSYHSLLIEPAFVRAFSNLPLIAIIDHYYLCLHGGIGPTFTGLNQINSLKRPILNDTYGPLEAILWSDPSRIVDTFKPNARGKGFYFGSQAVADFLLFHAYSAIIRGHECVESGIDQSYKKVITVFSASNYCGVSGNKSGVIVFSDPQNKKFVTYPPLNYMHRSDAHFTTNLQPLVFKKANLQAYMKEQDRIQASRGNLLQNNNNNQPLNHRSLYPLTNSSAKFNDKSSQKISIDDSNASFNESNELLETSQEEFQIQLSDLKSNKTKNEDDNDDNINNDNNNNNGNNNNNNVENKPKFKYMPVRNADGRFEAVISIPKGKRQGQLKVHSSAKVQSPRDNNNKPEFEKSAIYGSISSLANKYPSVTKPNQKSRKKKTNQPLPPRKVLLL